MRISEGRGHLWTMPSESILDKILFCQFSIPFLPLKFIDTHNLPHRINGLLCAAASLLGTHLCHLVEVLVVGTNILDALTNGATVAIISSANCFFRSP